MVNRETALMFPIVRRSQIVISSYTGASFMFEKRSKAGRQSPPVATEVVYRHRLPVRLWHWVNALCVLVLLLSGLQIFNWHPALYLGDDGHEGLPTLLSVRISNPWTPHPTSVLQIGRFELDTTGVLGLPHDTEWGVRSFTIPLRMVFPPSTELGLARGWHFLMAWVLVINAVIYVLYGFASGHFFRNFLPTREQLRPKPVVGELWNHLRLHRHRGQEARRYNLLQKLSYIVVVFVLVPAAVLSGLTMSNTITAVFPQLFDLFGGRQSARTVHFFVTVMLVLFVLVHVFQIVVAGFINEMRSMVSGRFVVPPEAHK
jgi:thiosulfate reductase cytochrome b subunit